ncbi:MAG TPA: hypothetical protein VGO47_04615 [Chlamydiales bacterium]|nr:hypothetical protein [Chlamydiales bacterium]
MFDVETWGGIYDDRSWRMFVKEFSQHLPTPLQSFLMDIATGVDDLESYLRKNKENAQNLRLFNGHASLSGGASPGLLSRLLVIDLLDRFAWTVDVACRSSHVHSIHSEFVELKNPTQGWKNEAYIGYDVDTLHLLLRNYVEEPRPETDIIYHPCSGVNADAALDSMPNLERAASNFWFLIVSCFVTLKVSNLKVLFTIYVN